MKRRATGASGHVTIVEKQLGISPYTPRPLQGLHSNRTTMSKQDPNIPLLTLSAPASSLQILSDSSSGDHPEVFSGPLPGPPPCSLQLDGELFHAFMS
jgi:hypothetical protein